MSIMMLFVPAACIGAALPSAVPFDLQKLNTTHRNSVVRIEFTHVRNRDETKLNPTKSEMYVGGDAEGSHGTGFFINDHEILTNAHVVEDARRGSIRIQTPATGNVEYRATVVGIGSSTTIDLALLRFPEDEQLRFKKRSGLDSIPRLYFGESEGLKQSEPLAIFGYPTISDELKVIQAEVTGRQYQSFGLGRFMVRHQFIEVGPGGVVQRGNSGGPALNSAGEVVGIPTLGDWNANQGWLIPIDIVKRFLGRIRDNRTGSRPLYIPELGLRLSKNFHGICVLAGAPEDITIFELGVVVREVIPRRQAEQWGMRRGDIIVGFANRSKGISCALDFEGYRVITGAMAVWPRGEGGASNEGKPKLHLTEMVFISEVGEEIDLWYLRPRKKRTGKPVRMRRLSRTITVKEENILPHIGLYEKPAFTLWGDFVAQDFNDFNTRYFDVPIGQILQGGVLVTYVEPNSLASRRGLEMSDRFYGEGFFPMGIGAAGTWYIIDSVDARPVRSLDDFRASLDTARERFEKKKASPSYDPARKTFYRERYVEIAVRSPSDEGKVTSRRTVFPVDEALESAGGD